VQPDITSDAGIEHNEQNPVFMSNRAFYPSVKTLHQNKEKNMTRDQAIELARVHAKAQPQSYYSEPFQPHAWVIEAILAAAEEGRVITAALDFKPDEHHAIADMANVGYSLMQSIKAHRPDYCWNESPAEIVGDLCDEIGERRQTFQ
jgi:hypothetical protein